jgi:hypothetical protein
MTNIPMPKPADGPLVPLVVAEDEIHRLAGDVPNDEPAGSALTVAGTTRPRGLPARFVRRGDQVAWAPGVYGAPITDSDHAGDERVRWYTVSRVLAGSSVEPMLLEFDDFPSTEFEVDDSVVVREVAAPGRPLPAAGQPLGAIVATHGEAFRKCEMGGPRPWRSADRFVSDRVIDEYLASGAELLRGEVAR